MHDDEITSDELDELLDKAETLGVDRPAGSTEVRLYVAVDADTLHELSNAPPPKGPTSALRRPTRCEPVRTWPERARSDLSERWR